MKRYCSHCHKPLPLYGSCEHRYASKPPTRTVKSILAALALIFTASAKAEPITYNFTQADWQPSGHLAGSFTGADADNNGRLSMPELAAFSAAFTGGPAFNLSHLLVFDYGLGDEHIKSIFAIKPGDERLDVSFDSSSVSYGPLGASTHAPAIVGKVPEPSTLVLLV